MIKSLRDSVEKSISGYYSSELTQWVLDWPGQVLSFCCWLSEDVVVF